MKRYALLGILVAIVVLAFTAGIGSADAQSVSPHGSDWNLSGF